MKFNWLKTGGKKESHKLTGVESVLAELKNATMIHVLVISDSHGRTDGIARLMEGLTIRPDLIVHLGDHCDDIDEIGLEFNCPIVGVTGNCDGSAASQLPEVRLLELAGYRIFMTHGHRYHVKYYLHDLIKAATSQQMDADIILFGHTHRYLCQQEVHQNHKFWLMNPGSCFPTGAGPTAIWLTLSDTHLNCQQLIDRSSCP